MPPRTNTFQELVAFFYQATAPLGAKVTESAMLRGREGGPEREIDILIEHNVAGHNIQIAIECRDRSRVETLDWIDSLIGKFAGLPIDRVVAITSKRFSKAAIGKAAANRIELVSAKAVETIDWATKFTPHGFRGMTTSYELLGVGTYDLDGKELTLTQLSSPAALPTHSNVLSKEIFQNLAAQFYQPSANPILALVESKISENWQIFIDDPSPRIVPIEEELEPGSYMIGSDGRHDISLIIYAVGVHFEVRDHSATGLVLRDRVLQKIEGQYDNFNATLKLISRLDGSIEHVELIHTPKMGNDKGRLLRRPRAAGRAGRR